MDANHRLIMQLYIASDMSLASIVDSVREAYDTDIPELTQEEAQELSVNFGTSSQTIYKAFQKNRHLGSTFESFLKEDGTYDEVMKTAVERIKAAGGRYVKRTNWTTEEVIKILQGCLMETSDGKEPEEPYNFALECAIDEFASFQLPEDEMGALAYSPEEDRIFHIGPIPEEGDTKSGNDFLNKF